LLATLRGDHLGRVLSDNRDLLSARRRLRRGWRSARPGIYEVDCEISEVSDVPSGEGRAAADGDQVGLGGLVPAVRR
jgi:hypothetical protein